MKKKFAIALLAFVLIGIVLVLITGGRNSYSPSSVAAKNIQYPHTDGQDMYFFTGHGFAKYSTGERKAIALTDFVQFPEIFEVDISSQGAVFKTTQTYPTDDLFYMLEKMKLPTNGSYWWYVNFADKKITVLGDKEGFQREVINAKWTEGNELLVARRNLLSTVPEFRLYKLASDQLEPAYTNTGAVLAELLWSDGNSALVSINQADRNKIVLYKIGFPDNSFEPLPETVGGNAIVNSKGESLAFTASITQDEDTKNDSPRGLYYFKLGSSEPDLLLKDFSGNVTPDHAGGFYIAGTSEGEKYLGKINNSGDLEEVNITDSVLDYSFASTGDKESQQIVIVDTSGQLYFLSTQDISYPEVSSVPVGATNINRTEYSAAYFESSDSFSILVTKNPYRQNVERALDELQSLGIDTNQHVIRANPVRTLRAVR